MSTSEERMLILKMLQEGKISSEEAAKLLEALDGAGKQAAGESTGRQYRQQQQPNFQEEVSKLRDRVHTWKKEFKANYNSNDFDRSVEEFAEKAEKLGKNVAATTFGIMDKVFDYVGSFVDSSAFNIFGSYAVVEKTFEAPVAEGMDLEIEGINGHIIVKKHLDNKIVITSKVRSPQNNADEILSFNGLGNMVSMKLNKTGNISVSHEILIPATKLKKVKLETTNGKIYVEDTLAENFEAVTRNNYIDLMGVNSDKILAVTKNSRVQMSYVIGREIEIATNNGVVETKNVKAKVFRAVTTNGRVLMENVQNLEGEAEMDLMLRTTNSGIRINMNDMENRGYKVKAKTTNSGVNLLIPDLAYKNINRQGGGSFVEAESNNYASYAGRVYVDAETLNGYIEVVK